MAHKTLDMTLRYSHLASNHEMQAANILDRVMSPNPARSVAPSKVISLSP